MKRYAVFAHLSPGYVVFDTLIKTVVARCHDRGRAERAARHLNGPTPTGRVLEVTESDRSRSLTYDNNERDARVPAVLLEFLKAVFLRERTYEIPTSAIAEAIANRHARERVRAARP